MAIERVAVIFNNPSAGSALSDRKLGQIKEEIGGHYSVVHTINVTGLEIALIQLRRKVATADTIFAFGGDGTIGIVANNLIELGSAASIAPIPTGTGNDMTSFMGVSKDPLTATRQLIAGTLKSFDYGLVRWSGPSGSGRHLFINSFGIGYDATVAFNVDRYKYFGPVGYVLAAIRSLVGWNNHSGRIQVDSKAERQGRFMFISVCNGKSSGGGFVMAPDASIDDGLLDYFVVGDITRTGALRLLPMIRLFGKSSSPKISVGTMSTMEISFDVGIPIHLDGEVLSTDVTWSRVECVKSGLSLLTPIV